MDESIKCHNIPHPKQRRFLLAYSVSGNISLAAEAAGIDRGSHYDWMRDDAVYAEAFRDADEYAIDLMEEESRRRAVEGVQEPVLYKGEQVLVPVDPANPGGEKKPLVRHRYSDALLMFRLSGKRPEKYRQNVRVDANVQGNVNVTNDNDALSDFFRKRFLPQEGGGN